MSIDLKHLRYAEAAERCGSFRKAADSLSFKQSNLSRRVRHLEDQLGIALFERMSGGVRATATGQDFLNGVRRVLNQLQMVVDGAKAVGRGEAGYLTIGFYTSLSAGNLRASLVEYGRRFPRVEIRTVEGSRTLLFDGIQNGTVDIAIVTGEPASSCNRAMALWSERIIVALPENHPLATNEIIYWTDLKRERFLLSERDPGPEIQDILVAKLSSPGDLPDVVRHDVSPENIKSLVGAGRGVSLMCEACIGASYAGVAYRELGTAPARLGSAIGLIGETATTIPRFGISFSSWRSAARRSGTGRVAEFRELPIRWHERSGHPAAGSVECRLCRFAANLHIRDEIAVKWSRYRPKWCRGNRDQSTL